MRRPLNIIVDIIRNPKYDPLMKNMKKIVWIYKLRNNTIITRAGLTANPLEMYNPTSLTTVGNNTLVQHGNLDFIGGDTQTFEFDFGTKVAGSVAECPMKFYSVYANTIKTPIDVWSTTLENTQSFIDYIKTQNNSGIARSSSTVGDIAQMMIELDLTAICNALFSGSNSALKSTLKSSSNIDIYSQGSGANASVLTNGVIYSVWNGTSWVQIGTNTTGTFAKINGLLNNSNYIQSTNKLYILIASQFASNGTISSLCSLDYLNIKIDLIRNIDVPQPISITL